MNKKIFALAILGMFLLAGVTTISVAEKTETNMNNNTKNLDPVPHLYVANNPVLDFYFIKPGSEISTVLYPGNDGDEYSWLKWEITEWPEWGTWKFEPSKKGECPGGYYDTVYLTITVPNQPEATFSGDVVFVNTEDLSNSVTITFIVKTIKTRQLVNPMIQQFFENLFEKFPLLENLFNFL